MDSRLKIFSIKLCLYQMRNTAAAHLRFRAMPAAFRPVPWPIRLLEAWQNCRVGPVRGSARQLLISKLRPHLFKAPHSQTSQSTVVQPFATGVAAWKFLIGEAAENHYLLVCRLPRPFPAVSRWSRANQKVPSPHLTFCCSSGEPGFGRSRISAGKTASYATGFDIC